MNKCGSVRIIPNKAENNRSWNHEPVSVLDMNTLAWRHFPFSFHWPRISWDQRNLAWDWVVPPRKVAKHLRLQTHPMCNHPQGTVNENKHWHTKKTKKKKKKKEKREERRDMIGLFMIFLWMFKKLSPTIPVVSSCGQTISCRRTGCLQRAEIAPLPLSAGNSTAIECTNSSLISSSHESWSNSSRTENDPIDCFA